MSRPHTGAYREKNTAVQVKTIFHKTFDVQKCKYQEHETFVFEKSAFDRRNGMFGSYLDDLPVVSHKKEENVTFFLPWNWINLKLC